MPASGVHADASRDAESGARRLRDIAIALGLVVVGLAVVSFAPHVRTVYQPDEGMWASVGKFSFETALLDRDWRDATWHNDDYGHFGPYNPMIGKYVIGGSLFGHGVVRRGEDIAGYPPDLPWEQAAVRRPPPEVLAAAREPMRWFAALSAAFVFLLGRLLLGSRALAAAAAALFLVQPLVVLSGRRAMMDMPALFFSLLGLLVAAFAVRRLDVDGFWRRVALAIATGVVCGLALGTKMNALLVPLTIAVWAVIDLLWSRRGTASRRARLARLLPSAALVAAGVAAVFYGSNPHLYTRPVEGLSTVVQLGTQVLDYEVPVEQRLGGWMDRAANMVATGWLRSGPIGGLLGARWLDVLLILTGLGVALWRVAGGARRRSVGHAWLLAWTAVFAAGTVLWVPYDWERWYLPMAPCWALLEAVGIGATAAGVAFVAQRAREVEAIPEA